MCLHFCNLGLVVSRGLFICVWAAEYWRNTYQSSDFFIEPSPLLGICSGPYQFPRPLHQRGVIAPGLKDWYVQYVSHLQAPR